MSARTGRGSRLPSGCAAPEGAVGAAGGSGALGPGARVGEAVEALEYDALAQRPRADLQLGDPHQVHHGVRDDGAGRHLHRPVLRHPGNPDALGQVERGKPSRPLAYVPMLQEPLHVEALARGCCPGDPGELPEGLRRADGVIDSAAAAQPAGHPGDLRPDVPAQLAYLRRGRRVSGEPVPGQPPCTERQRHHGLGLLILPHGDLKRPAADVDHEQPPRGPAEPPPGGQEGQPRLVLTGQDPDGRAGPVLNPGEHVVAVAGVAHGRGGEGEEILDALVLRDPQRLLDHLGQPLLADLGQCVAALQVGGERKFDLMRERGQRTCAWIGVNYQHVDGVRTDVQYPQSHDLTVPSTADRKETCREHHISSDTYPPRQVRHLIPAGQGPIGYRRLMRNGEVSYWWQARGGFPARRPSLPGPLEADVCIVGGGDTGLWTAYYLAGLRPGWRIVVLEAAFAGYGASGRNGGWVTAALPGSRARYARAAGGAAGVRALEEALRSTVDEVGRVCAAESIDCDFTKGGTLAVATSPAQLARMREGLAGIREWGDGEDIYQYLSRDETRARVNVAGALGGLYAPASARIQPAALAAGLAAAAERRGVEIYEATPASLIEPAGAARGAAAGGAAAGAVARTKFGDVRARSVLR